MSMRLVLAALLVLFVTTDAFAPLSMGQCRVGGRPGLRGHSVSMMAKKKAGGKGGGAAAKVQVLLKANVDGVGKANEVLTVNTGYYNNFLRPKALADLISDEEVEVKEAKEQEARDQLKQEAVDKAAALKEMGAVVMKRKVGAGGKIFGSVTSKQLCDEIKKKTGGKVVMGSKLKWDVPDVGGLGEFTAKVQLHPDVSATVKVSVQQEK